MIIVGICGASGSGKSTLAKRIKDSLACNCTIIGQDCYYRSFPHIPFEERCRLNYDEPSIFDLDEMLHDVQQLALGKPITVKGYDYGNHLRADSPDAWIQPPEVLILEGIHMFYDKRLCEMMSLKVYLHVDVTFAFCAASNGISRCAGARSTAFPTSIFPRSSPCMKNISPIISTTPILRSCAAARTAWPSTPSARI